MKNDYEAPAVKVALVVLRSAVLYTSGGDDPITPIEDE